MVRKEMKGRRDNPYGLLRSAKATGCCPNPEPWGRHLTCSGTPPFPSMAGSLLSPPIVGFLTPRKCDIHRPDSPPPSRRPSSQAGALQAGAALGLGWAPAPLLGSSLCAQKQETTVPLAGWWQEWQDGCTWHPVAQATAPKRGALVPSLLSAGAGPSVQASSGSCRLKGWPCGRAAGRPQALRTDTCLCQSQSREGIPPATLARPTPPYPAQPCPVPPILPYPKPSLKGRRQGVGVPEHVGGEEEKPDA